MWLVSDVFLNHAYVLIYITVVINVCGPTEYKVTYLRYLYICSWCSLITKMELVIVMFGCDCHCHGAVETLEQICPVYGIAVACVIVTNRYL